VSEDGAAERFWLQLRELHQEAGQPTPQQLVRLGQQQLHPIPISPSTINDWLTARHWKPPLRHATVQASWPMPKRRTNHCLARSRA
jgi:hypothetical protein